MKIKKEKVLLLVGVITFLITLVGATYAYFSVQLETSTSNMVLTAKTGKAGVVSLRTATPELKLKLGVEEMSKYNEGVYYADDEEDYVKSKSKGIHSLIELTITNDEEDNNIYKCNAQINISLNGNMASVLEKGDMILHLMGDKLNEEIDLSTLDNGETTIPIEIESIGNNTKKIRGYLEFTNKETEQNYLDNKSLELNITADNLQCDLTGRVGVYAKLNEEKKSFLTGRVTTIDSLLKPFVQTYIDNEQLKDVSFVDYINTDKAVATQDFTDTEKSPTGSVMGWIEEDSEYEGYYNLYIGSENDIYAESLGGVFKEIGNVANIHLENLHFEKATSTQYMFNQTSVYNEITYDIIDTSNVTDIGSMFYNSASNSEYYDSFSALEFFDFETWDTSQVTNMSLMFSGVTSDNIDLSSWDTSKVTSMSSMFSNAQIGELNMEGLDISNVTDVSYMFQNAQIDNLNMNGCVMLNDGGSLKSDKMTENATISNLNYENWTIGNNLLPGTLLASTNYSSFDLRSWNTSNLTETNRIFRGIPSNRYIEKLDLSGWDTSNIVSINSLIYGKDIATLNLSDWNTSNITDMSRALNFNSIVNLDLSGWDVSNVQGNVNVYTPGLKSLNLSNWKITDNNYNIVNQFFDFSYYGVSNVTLNVSNWDLTEVTNIADIFNNNTTSGKGVITKIEGIETWDTSKITNMRAMFNEMGSLTSLDLSGWDTSNVTDMSVMFSMQNSSSKLAKLDLSSFHTKNVTDMSFMFNFCIALEYLDMRNADFSHVKTYSLMFNGVPNGITIIVKNEENRDWINKRLEEAGVTGNVLLPSEL